MFDAAAMHSVADSEKATLNNFNAIKNELSARFEGMDAAVEALVLAVACGEPLLFIGPPGTGKSRLIRSFCILTGLLKSEDLSRTTSATDSKNYFEYLLTPFTEPTELFGFWDFAKAQSGEMVRVDRNMMQKAKVVYLDEVFNGSSAILNSILTFMNERIFHDRGEPKNVDMECLFGATNQVGEAPELRAIFDRFVIRCRVLNAPGDRETMGRMVSKGWNDTYGTPLRAQFNDSFFENAKQLRRVIRQRGLQPMWQGPGENKIGKALTQMIATARKHNLSEVSNRRLVKLIHAMLIHRLLQGNRAKHGLADYRKSPIGPEQLKILPRFFLDNESDEQAVDKLLGLADDAELE